MIINDSIEEKNELELLSVIKSSKIKMGLYKKKIEHPDYYKNGFGFEAFEIKRERERIKEAIKALEAKGKPYLLSEAEKRAKRFEDNIDNISKMVFEIGPEIELKTRYELYFEEKEISFVSFMGIEELERKTLDKQELISALKELYIGEWKSHYDVSRFDVRILDGISWSLRVEYNNGKKPASFSGINDYPYNFDDLIGLFCLDDGMEITMEGEEL